MKIYAVVDKKAKHVVSIFTSLNDEAAERSFLMLLTGAKSLFTDFPEDFALYKVCDLGFSGSTLSVDTPESDVLREHGFKPGGFTISEAFKDGNEYDKRYLKMVMFDRLGIEENESEEK